MSVATHGKEEADKVRITQGKIGLNEFYVQDNLKSYPQPCVILTLSASSLP